MMLEVARSSLPLLAEAIPIRQRCTHLIGTGHQRGEARVTVLVAERRRCYRFTRLRHADCSQRYARKAALIHAAFAGCCCRR